MADPFEYRALKARGRYVVVRVSEQEYDVIDEMCGVLGLNRSDLMRLGLQRLAEQEGMTAPTALPIPKAKPGRRRKG